MRKIILALSVIALSCTQSFGQDLDQILKKHFKAQKQTKIEKVQTITTRGKNSIAMAGIEGNFTMYQARPDKLCIKADIQGSELIQCYNGTTAWLYAPGLGISPAQEITGDQLSSFKEQASFESPLWKYQEKGLKLELTGDSKDGSAYEIKLTIEDGRVSSLFIDKENWLISGMSSTQSMAGAEALMEVQMKDYKKVKGIPSAHYISTKMDGEIQTTVVIESISYNQEIDPSLFEKPGGE